MPIVTMSPVLKLREGPEFAFGARWALVQYHAWTDRRQFIEMDDDAVKEKFRAWIEGPGAPWYLRDEYFAENDRRLRGAGSGKERAPKQAGSISKKIYNQRLQQFLDAEDYAGAAAFQEKYGEVLENVEAEDECDGNDANCDGNEAVSDTEESSADEPRDHEDTHVLKMLYKGNIEEINRANEETRRGKCGISMGFTDIPAARI